MCFMSWSLITFFTELYLTCQHHYFWHLNVWKESMLDKPEQFLPSSHAAYQWQSQDMQSMSQHSASWTGPRCFWVMRVTMRMKMTTSHVCILLGKVWSKFTDKSSLPHGSSMKKSGGLMVCPVRHRENGRAVTQWSFLAPRSVSLLTCHSCCLFRSEVFFCSHKVINSSKFPFLRPSWCHCSVFLSFLIHGIFKLEIIIQSFPHFFNMWELLAPLGVCIHWSVTAGERLCERIPLPANSWNNSTDECGIAQKLFPPEVQSIPPLSLLSPLGNVIFTIFHFT